MKKNIELKGGKTIFVERDEIVSAYLNDIRNYNVLTPAEEEDCVKKAQQGDIKARNMLIESNQRYIFAVAKKYASGDDLMDLVSEGNNGLQMAIEKFDLSRGMRFLSFAKYYVKRSMLSYKNNDEMLIKKSNNAKTSYKLEKIQNDFFFQNGRYPSVDEVKELFKDNHNIEIDDDSDLYDVRVNSINSPYSNDDEDSFEDSSEFTTKTSSMNSYVEESNNDYIKTMVASLLDTLNERDRTIIKMAFGIDNYKEFNNIEIGEALGYSAERIRQLKAAAIAKMTKAVKQVNI